MMSPELRIPSILCFDKSLRIKFAEFNFPSPDYLLFTLSLANVAFCVSYSSDVFMGALREKTLVVHRDTVAHSAATKFLHWEKVRFANRANTLLTMILVVMESMRMGQMMGVMMVESL